MENGVFISYRREQGFAARAIKQHLEDFGYSCFLDVENLSEGCFSEKIFSEITTRKHFLLLVGKGTFAPSGGEVDWMLEEVKVALRAQRNIVPLFLEDEAPEELTRVEDSELASLRTMNGLRLDHAYFLQAMEKLRTAFLPNRGREEENKKLAETYYAEATAIDRKEGDNPESWRRQLALLDQAVRLVPREGTFRVVRANLNYLLDRKEHALHDLGVCIEMGHDLEWCYVIRGDYRVTWDEHQLALSDYSKCLEINPRNAKTLRRRALCHQVMKNPELAIADCSRALEIDPGDAEARGDRGKLLADLGKLSEALGDLTGSIENGSEDSDVFKTRGGLLDKLGRDREALADYEKAISLLEDKREIEYLWDKWRTLERKAEIHLRRQEASAAAKELSRAIEQMERIPRGNFLFAHVYETRAKAWRVLGKRWKAIQDERKFRQLKEAFLAEVRKERRKDGSPQP